MNEKIANVLRKKMDICLPHVGVKCKNSPLEVCAENGTQDAVRHRICVFFKGVIQSSSVSV